MVRRIEDMKVNKERKLPPIKEVIQPAKPIEPPLVDFKEREAILKEIEDARQREKELEKKEALKVNEYIESISERKQRLQRTPQLKYKPKIIHKLTLFIFILAVIAGGVFWGGNIFQKAYITITAKHKSLTFNNNQQFVASKDSNDNSIDFEIMITPSTESKDMILTETKSVSAKATGSITLYNAFGTTPQKLPTSTFISDPDGKAYKTSKAVTIPGYTTVNKKIVPGQIDVNISSFLAGDTYNGSPSDFYISSFKGTAKYNKIYGKLKSPLVGGESGLVYVLDDVTKSKIDNLAHTAIKEDLLRQVSTLIPPGYILYPDAFTFTYNTDDNFMSKTPEATVPIDGTLSVVLLKENSLINNITKISLPNISASELNEISISDLSKLTFGFTNNNQVITKDTDSISFSLSGNVDAVWNPDLNALRAKLPGISKEAVLSIFSQDPGISSALVKIFPPWQKYIPSDLSKINIVVN